MFDGYILVGGGSSRMKTNKAALCLGGITFAERAAAALRRITEGRVNFVTGANHTNQNKILPPDVPQLTDIVPQKAALGGIYTALAHSKNEWAIILACDYPLVTEDLFDRLAKIAGSVNENTSAIVPIQPDGRVQPLCAFYRVKPCLIVAEKLLKNEKIPPVRQLLDKIETRAVSFAELSDLRGAENFFNNVNAPDDFLHAQSIYQTTQNNSEGIF